MKDKLVIKLVIGYIGSLRELEGVDLTAEAVSILKKKGIDVNLFVLSSQSGQDERAYCKLERQEYRYSRACYSRSGCSILRFNRCFRS